jgi:geranylgeranyl reductase family protein
MQLKGRTGNGMIARLVARFDPSNQCGDGMRSQTSLTRGDALLKPDVVIVGAGPAGCGAAYDLSVRGVRVLLLDRTGFPRKKTCAEGLTVKAVRRLRYPVDPVIQNTVFNLSVSCRMRHRTRLTGIDPVCHMVDRSAFDLFCLNRTVAAGARFSVVERIHEIAETEHGVTVAIGNRLIRTRFLIAADGVHSRVRYLTGRFPGFQMGFAVEGLIPGAPSGNSCMDFDFSRVNGGYGWVFPKAGHTNVGLYSAWPGVRITRQQLAVYAALKTGRQPPIHVAGYHLGMGGWRYRPGCGRVLLAGDAAGLVDPLLGEGLYHAIASGQHAAAAVSDALDAGTDACQAYAKRLTAIQRDLLFSRAVSALFYGLPVAGHRLLISPMAAIPLMAGFSRGMPLSHIFCNGYRFWFDRLVNRQRNWF